MIGVNIIIGCIYRPPNYNLTQFSECVSSILKNVSKPNKHVYLLGDYNIDLLKARSHQPTSEFIDNMLCSSFIPLINRPTRITENSAKIIDNIFTNCHNVSNHITGIIPTDVSDHFSIFHVLFNNFCSEENDIKIYKRTVNAQAINSCKVKLQNTNWSNVIKTMIQRLHTIYFMSDLIMQ